jgi:hypothetical protein
MTSTWHFLLLFKLTNTFRYCRNCRTGKEITFGIVVPFTFSQEKIFQSLESFLNWPLHQTLIAPDWKSMSSSWCQSSKKKWCFIFTQNDGYLCFGFSSEPLFMSLGYHGRETILLTLKVNSSQWTHYPLYPQDGQTRWTTLTYEAWSDQMIIVIKGCPLSHHCLDSFSLHHKNCERRRKKRIRETW